MYESISTDRTLNLAEPKPCKSTEISDLIHILLKNQQESKENIHSLQKAVAGSREQLQDSRAEHAEDNAEVKRLLQELRHNKTWLSRERL
jgi:hypothetical protein